MQSVTRLTRLQPPRKPSRTLHSEPSTVTASIRNMDRQPAALVNSLASQVISEQYGWDQTRFGAMPTGGGGKTVPTDASGEQGTYWTWWITWPMGTSAYALGTYNGRSNECISNYEWSDPNWQESEWVFNATDLTVFGDSSCSYTTTWTKQGTDDPTPNTYIGFLTCGKWKDAKCYQDKQIYNNSCNDTRGSSLFNMAYCNWQ